MTEKIQSIPARIKNIAKGGHVAGTEDIIDDASGKTQKEINTETGNKVDALQKQDIEAVTSLPAISSADPKKIYRVAGETSYTDYMLNADGSQFVAIATYSFPGIDDVPTAGSNNLVKSSSVYEENLQNGIAYIAGGLIPTFLETWNGNIRTLTVIIPGDTFRIYDSKGVGNAFVSISGTYTVTNFKILVYDRIDKTAKVINFGGTNPDRYYILLGISVNAIYGLLAPHYYAWKDKSDYFAYIPSGQVYKGEFNGTSYKILAQETNFEVRIYDKGFSDNFIVNLNEDYIISPARALIIDLADSNTVKIINFTQDSIFANKIVLLSNGRDGLNGLLAGHVYTYEINKLNSQKVSFGFIGSHKLKNLYENRLAGGITPSSTTIGDTITVSFYNSASFENAIHYCKAGTKLFVNIAGGNTTRPAIFVVNMQGVLKDKIVTLSGQYTLTVAEDSIVYINLWSASHVNAIAEEYIFSTQEEPDFSFNLFTEGIYSPYGIRIEGSTIGAVATVNGIYDNSSHTYRSVGTILYKGETVKFYKMAGADDRPSFDIIDIETSKLLFKTIDNYTQDYTNYAQCYTATSDCYIVSNSRSYSQTPFVSIGGVDKGEARRRIAYLLSIRNPLYNGQNDGWDFDNYINSDTLVRLQTALASKDSPSDKTVSLVHFSDLHGSVDGLKSVLNFKKKYGGSINNILNTGDTVQSHYADGTWDTLAAVDGIGTILAAVGNHDGSSISGDNHDWEGVPKIDVYNRYFKPYISNWGVVQPSDAEINGYCYYYKDYVTQKLRLIVLDDIISSNAAYYTAQATWLTGVLADAKTNGYSVVIAQHSRPSGIIQDINGFNSVYEPSGGFYPNDAARDAVDAFIEAGGDFVCWLLGHTHFDATRILTEYHNQIVIVISATAVENSNYIRRNFTESTLFNVVSFNTNSKMIKVARIGAHIDNCMQDNRSFCINWITKKGWKAN